MEKGECSKNEEERGGGKEEVRDWWKLNYPECQDEQRRGGESPGEGHSWSAVWRNKTQGWRKRVRWSIRRGDQTSGQRGKWEGKQRQFIIKLGGLDSQRRDGWREKKNGVESMKTEKRVGERERERQRKWKQTSHHPPHPSIVAQFPLKVAVLFFFQCRQEGGKDEDGAAKGGWGGDEDLFIEGRRSGSAASEFLIIATATSHLATGTQWLRSPWQQRGLLSDTWGGWWGGQAGETGRQMEW